MFSTKALISLLVYDNDKKLWNISNTRVVGKNIPRRSRFFRKKRNEKATGKFPKKLHDLSKK